MAERTIYLDNDWIIRRRLSEWNPDTDMFTALQAAPAVGFLSATPDGDAIDVSLLKPLVERQVDGDYYAVIEGDDLRTHLDAYLGKTIYEVVLLGADGDYRDYIKLFVAENRHSA